MMPASARDLRRALVPSTAAAPLHATVLVATAAADNAAIAATVPVAAAALRRRAVPR